MRHEVVIIGGGIVGLSCALDLAERGVDVAVVDAREIGAGCATGSAGHIVPSHVIPLAAPGAVRAAIGSLIDREGAVSVRWTSGPELWRWLAAFASSSRRVDLGAAAPSLGALGALSVTMIGDWIDRYAIACHYRTDGLLDVYGDPTAFEAAKASAMTAAEYGVPIEVLDAAGARGLEPALNASVIGAIRYPGDANMDPTKFLEGVTLAAQQEGASLLAGTEVYGISHSDRTITEVQTTIGPIASDHVVLAAGAWSGRLARVFGENVPVQPGRGFSLTSDRPEGGPKHAMLLGEKHVAVGPMGDALRLSGRFEVGRFGTEPEPHRITQIERLARSRLDFGQLTIRRTWAGLRPVTPDGMPIISRSSRWDNVTIATGHAMIGLSIGPGTGRLIAQLITDQPPEIDIDRFSIRRFQ